MWVLTEGEYESVNMRDYRRWYWATPPFRVLRYLWVWRARAHYSHLSPTNIWDRSRITSMEPRSRNRPCAAVSIGGKDGICVGAGVLVPPPPLLLLLLRLQRNVALGALASRVGYVNCTLLLFPLLSISLYDLSFLLITRYASELRLPETTSPLHSVISLMPIFFQKL